MCLGFLLFFRCPVLTKFSMFWKVLVVLPNINFMKIHSTIVESLQMDKEIGGRGEASRPIFAIFSCKQSSKA